LHVSESRHNFMPYRLVVTGGNSLSTATILPAVGPWQSWSLIATPWFSFRFLRTNVLLASLLRNIKKDVDY